MANIYMSRPNNPNSWDDDRETQAIRDTYSLAEIVFKDGTKTEFMVKASPSVVPHLTKEMKQTGQLVLWNDTDTLCIAADQIKFFCLRHITK